MSIDTNIQTLEEGENLNLETKPQGRCESNYDVGETEVAYLREIERQSAAQQKEEIIYSWAQNPIVCTLDKY